MAKKTEHFFAVEAYAKQIGKTPPSFLNKIDKMAVFGLHISKILHEKTFGRKNTRFLRVLQITDFQLVDSVLAKKGLRSEKKVNAF
ncbi:MAG: hypothetical protein IJ243_03020 [Prevotella sp.]|nr:hypothetical protein [Prevotella sp.]